jgi:hypothetical protein
MTLHEHVVIRFLPNFGLSGYNCTKCRMSVKNVIQAAFVIRGLVICEFVYSKLTKVTIFHSKWPFYLQIQDSRSKMAERIYRKLRGEPVLIKTY